MLWRILLALIISTLLAVPSFAATKKTQYIPGEILVKYKKDIPRGKTLMDGIYKSIGAQSVKRVKLSFGTIEQYRLEAGRSIEQTVALLKKNPAVQYVQPNYVLSLFDEDQDYHECEPVIEFQGCTPFGEFIEGRPGLAARPAPVNPPVADPYTDKVWGLQAINAPAAWQVTTGSDKIVVAVIDTGVDYNHEDLAFNMWRDPASRGMSVGYDFVHDDNMPFDDNMHGTHVSGTIGAVGGNGKGIIGVSPRVSIMALKFLSESGSGSTMDAVRAIDFAVEHGARILSNSWGGGGTQGNDVLRESIARAEERGALFVAAAGNDGADNDVSPEFPAGFNAPNEIAVAATDSNDRRANFSNYGLKTVHLGAPGKQVYSSVPGNKYMAASGTSMATPMVSGAAALLWSVNPNMTFMDVKKRLMETVDPLPDLQGKTITGGRLNIGRAVAMTAQDGGQSEDDGEWMKKK